MNVNPYAAPATDLSETVLSAAEAIRESYIKHEASVKSIGMLYLLAAIFLVPLGLMTAGAALFGILNSNNGVSSAYIFGLGVSYFALGAAHAGIAIGLRRLQPWARAVAAIFSLLGLIAFPIGTIISVYFLYLLMSKKGQYVFSQEYKQVIAETPHIKYRTSMVVVVLLILLLLLLFGGISFLLVSP